MKNICSLFILFILLSFSAIKADADCATGYACSIKDLEKQEQQQTKKENEAVQKSPNKDKKHAGYLKKKTNREKYDNIFVLSKSL